MDPTITQGLIAVLNQIANSENDLAALIGAEVNKINAFVSSGTPGFNDVIALNSNVEQTLATIVNKNMLLESTLQDALAGLDQQGVTVNVTPGLADALGGILASIGNEVQALGNLINAEANKINFVAANFPGNLGALTAVNNSANQMIRTINNKQIVLGTKLLAVMNFVRTHT